MTTLALYNPHLHNLLAAYAKREAWDELCAHLATLSHSQHRSASVVLADNLLTDDVSAEGFWALFERLAMPQPKVYLGTFLKALATRYRNHTITLDDDRWTAFANAAAERQPSIDRRKALAALLPLMETPEAIEQQLKAFRADGNIRIVAVSLLDVATTPARYVLFQHLRKADHETELITEICRRLIKQNTGEAFNMASLLTAYFGLTSVRATFSLRLSDYEFSRIEQDYKAFTACLSRI